MYQIRFVIYSLIIALLFGACGQEEKLPRGVTDLTDFYFTQDTLKEGLVYEYNSPDSFPPYYVHYFTQVNDTAEFLYSNRYDNNFRQEILSIEQIGKKGTKLERSLIYDYQYDSVAQRVKRRQIEIGIDKATIFPFYGRKDRAYVTRQTFATDDVNTYVITRNRQYAKDTVWTFDGEEIPAIKMIAKESRISRSTKQGDSSFNVNATET